MRFTRCLVVNVAGSTTETGPVGGLTTRVREHRADLRYHRASNAFVAHVDQAGHLPDWTSATSVKIGLTKVQRRILEAAVYCGGKHPQYFAWLLPSGLGRCHYN